MGSIIDVSEALLVLGLSSSVTDEERAIVNASIGKAEGAIKRHLRYDPTLQTHTEFYPRQPLHSAGSDAVWESEGELAVLRRSAEEAITELQLQHIPVRSITELFVDYEARSGTRSGAFPASSAKVEGTDYWPNFDAVDSDGNSLCVDGIIRSEGSWPTTPGTVKVVYVAGYTAEELHGQDSVIDASPIVDAVIDEVVRRAKKAFVMMKSSSGWSAGPKISERLGDYAYTIDASSLNRLVGSTSDITPETREKLSGFVNWGWVL